MICTNSLRWLFTVLSLYSLYAKYFFFVSFRVVALDYSQSTILLIIHWLRYTFVTQTVIKQKSSIYSINIVQKDFL